MEKLSLWAAAGAGNQGQRQLSEIRGSDKCKKSVAAAGVENQGGAMGIEEASVISDFSDMPGIEESSDTSVDMEVPYLPHVVEIFPSGDNMYQPVGHDEQAEIKLVADNKFEVGVSDSSTYPPTTYILNLWSKHEPVRNVALVGHLHHGKTVFMYMLADGAVLIVDAAE
ncbi:hypothetical protein L6452_35554 [Arctium lappa]|uniref:Uncharacterized protein n=1 Tax=Arctium lappa TaxID=4217 RepID=A0ACB8Y6R3_ARCLA|nr:hypothetical protein L6452_35554 [Arctium lappa]